jgi:regulator of replication initiation timing
LLSNYSHIFHKVETVASQSEALNKDKTALLSSLAVEQENLATAKAKISSLETDKAEAAAKYQALKEEFSSVKEENAGLKLENAQLKDKIAGNKPAVVVAPKEEAPTQASKLAELTELYEKAFSKKVPNNKKSDTEWIANALAKAPASE